jgi:geranylgeranyl transferase type-2 subunit beta
MYQYLGRMNAPHPRTFVAFALLAASLNSSAAAADKPPSPDQILDGLRTFFKKTAKPDGSFRPGIDPDYEGMSDSAFSDLAPVAYAVVLHKTFGWPLPNEEKTRQFLLNRQQADGTFINVAGTTDPKSAAGRAYNTTMAVMALRALGTKPKLDPLPVFSVVLKADYKTLPLYMTSFFPLAYLASGKEIPAEADEKIRALMVQDADGYLNEHVAATFHAAHYYRLTGRETPKADAMVKRTLREQKTDGSWLRNPPARDRHATFDAVFVLNQLGGDRDEVRDAIEKAGKWALSCRNSDGGFGHFPGSTSDADACYFQVGTLVMAGVLKPVEIPPADAKLLGWGHLFPVGK